MLIPELNHQKYKDALAGYSQRSKTNSEESPERQRCGTPKFDSKYDLNQEIKAANDIILYQFACSKTQSAHLNSIIDLTLHTMVEYDDAQLLQNQLSLIDFENLGGFRVKQTNTLTFKVLQPQQKQVKASFCSVNLNESSKLKSQGKEQFHSPRVHNCMKEEKRQKYAVPQQYRAVESQYSPKRLPQYLNRQHLDFSLNRKWLNYGVEEMKKKKQDQPRAANQSFDSIVLRASEDLKRSLITCQPRRELPQYHIQKMAMSPPLEHSRRSQKNHFN